MTAKVKAKSLKTVGLYCEQCKGTCWKGSDNAATQRAAKEKFGIIPNNCVNGEGGSVHCPFNM